MAAAVVSGLLRGRGRRRRSRGRAAGGPQRGAEMVLLTMIARVADGLPLAASMQEDEQVRAGGAGGAAARRVGEVRAGPGPASRAPASPSHKPGGSRTSPVGAGGRWRAASVLWGGSPLSWG